MNNVDLANTTSLTQPSSNPIPRGQITQQVISIMKAGRDLPMAEVCAGIAKECSMNMSYARAWYRDFVNRDIAPGVITKAPSRADTRKLMGLPEPEKKTRTQKAPTSAQEASVPDEVPTVTLTEQEPAVTVEVPMAALTADQKRALKNAKERARRAAKKVEDSAKALAG